MTNITPFIAKVLTCFGFIFWSAATNAQVSLTVPNLAKEQIVEQIENAKYEMPIGPWDNGAIPTKLVKGHLWQRAWQLESSSITVDQLAEPIIEQMSDAGFSVVFDCHAARCGGFDFRYSTQVFHAPVMFVDLRNFRFIAFEKSKTVKTLLVSKAGDLLSFQLIEVDPAPTEHAHISHKLSKSVRGSLYTDMQTELLQNGYAVLSDLVFETGSSKLGSGPFTSLAELAQFMQTEPAAEIILVGHTDNTGASDANITLSKRRANSVAERLSAKYGITKNRLSAEGVGFLAPLTSNGEKAGREKNRRVEAVVKSLR